MATKKLLTTLAILLAAALASGMLVLLDHNALAPHAAPSPSTPLDATAPPPAIASAGEPVRDLAREALPRRADAASRASTAPDGMAVRGQAVWEEDGTPAAGVTVWCQDAAGSPLDRLTTATDAHGWFTFPSLPARVLVVGADRGGQLTVVRPVAVRLVIPRGCEVRGLVHDSERRPVARAEIWLSERWIADGGSVVAHTDAEGRFCVRGVGAERYVGARAPGHRPSPVHYVQARAGESVMLDLLLARGDARVQGRVFDTEEQPLAGALVRVSPPDAPPWLGTGDGSIVRAWAATTARTARDGSFAIAGLLPGTLVVQARAREHGVFTTTLEVMAGASGDVTAVLPKAATVIGRVTARNGAPLAKAMVRAGDWNDLARAHDVTGADGTFVLRDVTPGIVALTVLVDGRQAHRGEVAVAAGQTARWDVVVIPEPTIAGRLLDSAHQPLASWNVSARRGKSWCAHAVTDAAGRFVLSGLEQAAHTLRVSNPPTTQRAVGHGDVAVLQQDDVWPNDSELLIVVPSEAMPTCRVHGRALDAAGHVVPQTRVTVGHMGGEGLVTLDVEEGSGAFAVAALPPGAYWIEARAAGHAAASAGRRELAAGQDLDVGQLVLAAGGTIRGEVFLPQGAGPADDLEVLVLDAHNRISGTLRRDGARFDTSVLAAGDYRVLVHGPGVAATAVPCAVAVDQNTQIEVHAERGVRRRVRAVLPAASAEPRWVWISLMQGDRLMLGRALERQPDGSYAGDVWLAPGAWTAWLGTDSGAGGHGDLTVDAARAEAPVLDVLLRAPTAPR